MRRRVFIYGLAALSVSGCWLGELAVRNVDTVIEYRVAKSLALYHPQKERLEKDTSKFLNNSKYLVPPTREKIREYKKAIQKPAPSADKIKKEILFWKNLYIEVMDRAIEKHISYLSSLTKKQQKLFLKEAEKKNKELLKKLEEGSLASVAPGYEMFFGELNKKQMAILKANEDFLKKRSAVHIERRIAFQKGLQKLYAESASDQDFKDFAKSSVRQRFSSEATQKQAELIRQLILAVDEEQRKTLANNLERVDSWAVVFNATEY